MADFMFVKDAAALWNISERQVSGLCSRGKIPGAVKQGTPIALSWPILFFGNCRSIMRIRTFGRVSAELWNQGEWRLSAVDSWLARRAP